MSLTQGALKRRRGDAFRWLAGAIVALAIAGSLAWGGSAAEAAGTPTLTSPTDGAVLTSTTVTFEGDNGNGADPPVVFDANRGELCTGIVHNEHWVCDATLGDDARYEVHAESGAGRSNTITFTVRTAPTQPTISQPAEGATVGSLTPTIDGTGDPGTTLVVGFQGGGTVCSTTVTGGNRWQCAPTAPLVNGQTYTIVATSTRTGGGSTTSLPRSFTVRLDFNAPTITAPANNTSINTAKPTIDGTGNVGDTIAVTDSVAGQVCSNLSVTSSGWTCTSSKTLTDGVHTLTATGSTGKTGTTTFTVDTVPPATPTIDSPDAGSLTNKRLTPVTGTAENGSTVRVYEGSTLLCTAPMSSSGRFACTTSSLVDGQHTISAIATDAATNQSGRSPTVAFTVDATAPAMPTITEPANGSSTQNTSPAIRGTAERLTTVVVSEGGTQVCSTVATVAGTWRCEPSTAFSQGVHTLSATATDAAENASPPVTSRFTVDSIAPNAPEIEKPAAGSSTNQQKPAVSGTAEANAIVDIIDENGDAVCTHVVATGGAWSCTSALLFTEGDHTLTATATDAAGNVSEQSADTTFTVDLTAPGAPAITTPKDGAVTSDSTPRLAGSADVGTTVVVRDQSDQKLCEAVAVGGAWSCESATLADGKYTVTPTATDDAGNATSGSAISFSVDTTLPAAPSIVDPADGSTINTPKPSFTGTGETGSTVTVRDQNDAVVCEDAVVDGSGQWTCSSARTYQDGPLTFTPTAIDEAGNAAAGEPVTVELDTAAPAAPRITEPVDDVVSATTTVTVSGIATDPDPITVVDGTGAKVCGPVKPSAGTWTCGEQEFAEGTHTLTAVATDAAGNEAHSAPVTFEVDLTAPDAPAGVACVEAANGTATCTGSDGPAGGTAIVRDAGGRDVGQTTIGTDGSWTIVTDAPVPEYPAVVQYRDRAGNESATTELPVPPQITSPKDGTLTNQARPEISGSATQDDGAEIAVHDEHGTLVCSAPVTAGTWSCRPRAALAEGDPTLRATAADAADNSFAGRPVEVTVDTIAPASPKGSCVRNPNGTVTCGGRAEARSTVRIVDPSGVLVGEAVAAADGSWSITSQRAVAGDVLIATARDAAGNVSGPGRLAIRDANPGGPGGPGTPGGSGGSGGSGGGGSGGFGVGGGNGSGQAGAAGFRGGDLAFTGSSVGDVALLGLTAMALIGAGVSVRLRRGGRSQ